MSGTIVGSRLNAANRLVMTRAEYDGMIESGMKRCTRGKCWCPAADFGKDADRPDGLSSSCLAHRRVLVRKNTKGRSSAFKGHTHTDQAKFSMSAARKGRLRPWQAGPYTQEARDKISAAHRVLNRTGPLNSNWKGGVAVKARGQRFSWEYSRWRRDVFRRDGFACQDCGDAKGGNLTAHHVKPFADFPELRLELSNGITVCCECHGKRHDKPGSVRKIKAGLQAMKTARMAERKVR